MNVSKRAPEAKETGGGGGGLSSLRGEMPEIPGFLKLIPDCSRQQYGARPSCLQIRNT